MRVKGWIAELTRSGLSSSRVRQSYQLFSMIIKAAVESEYLAKTPCVGVRIPRVTKREAEILTEEQIEAVAAAVDKPEYRTLIYVLAYGGLRWGEACALRRRRCDLLRSHIEVVESLAELSGHFEFGETKTYARRWVRLPRFVSDMVALHLRDSVADDPDALVFTSEAGIPLRNSNVSRRVWHPALDAGGISAKVRMHGLRYNCASLLSRQAASKAVQQQLGHSTPMVTLNVYAHLFNDDLDRLYEGPDAPLAERFSNPQTASRRPGAVLDLQAATRKEQENGL
ncbi:MAG TPA: tyrosine-type recombinase/integrase [Isosphaeraceae bacterium]|nr:tyrosine-type recombinase/integrase [Isosphaeraceae bacterium]